MHLITHNYGNKNLIMVCIMCFDLDTLSKFILHTE